MLSIWIIGTASTAIIALVIWGVLTAMGETGNGDVWAARMFCLSPVWPGLLVLLVVLIARTALQRVEK